VYFCKTIHAINGWNIYLLPQINKYQPEQQF